MEKTQDFEQALSDLVGHLTSIKSAARTNSGRAQPAASITKPGNALARPMGAPVPGQMPPPGLAAPMMGGNALAMPRPAQPMPMPQVAPQPMPAPAMAPPQPQPMAMHPAMTMSMPDKIMALAKQAKEEIAKTGKLTSHTIAALDYAHNDPAIRQLLEAVLGGPKPAMAAPPPKPAMTDAAPKFSASSGRYHAPDGKFSPAPEIPKQ